MFNTLRTFAAASAAIVTLACSTSSSTIDMSDSKRVVGTDAGVQVDAQILSSSTGSMYVRFEVENRRDQPIALAEWDGAADFDTASSTLTLNVGAEIPEKDALRHIHLVASGERRAFTVSVATRAFGASRSRLTTPRFVRVRLNYLSSVEPFGALLADAGKLTAPRAERLSAELFVPWIENKEALLTNAVPIEWARASAPPTSTARH